MPKLNRGVFFALPFLLLPGCFYPADRGRLLEAKVDKLTAENQSLNEQVTAQKAELLPKIDQKIVEVTRALNSLDQASRRSGADTGVQLQKTIEDVAQLRGQVDAYQHSIQELDAKVSSLQASQSEQKNDPARRETDARREAEKLPHPADKRQFFALAEGKAKNGDTAVARQLFRDFIKRWPRDKLAADAYYAIGDGFYSEKSCEEALPEFGKVVQDFPKSRSAAPSLLRSSDCFKALGKPTESKYALEEILKSYPRSEAARAAKLKLVELSRKKGSGKRTAAK